MKFWFLAAVAACALFVQAAPVMSATVPAITVIPLTPTHIGVSGANPRCFSNAAVDGTPYWEMPDISAAQGVSGTVQLTVALNSTGGLTKESVYSSSGNWLLDAAAMRSARMSRFTPEVVNCERVSGTYLYQVEF